MKQLSARKNHNKQMGHIKNSAPFSEEKEKKGNHKEQ